MIGRVPVRVAGSAPNNSFLVPSGGDDGLARAVTVHELEKNATLRMQCMGVVWKQLEPDDDGTPRVLVFVAAKPGLPAFGEIPNIFEVATLSVRLQLRPYQKECYECALHHNTGICLPTGKGKTLVAARILETYLQTEPGNKALFMVPTRALVEQQVGLAPPPAPFGSSQCSN